MYTGACVVGDEFTSDPQACTRLRVQKVPDQKQIKMRYRIELLHLLFLENNSILEHAAIKTGIEQTLDRVGGRLDYRLTHAIE